MLEVQGDWPFVKCFFIQVYSCSYVFIVQLLVSFEEVYLLGNLSYIPLFLATCKDHSILNFLLVYKSKTIR